MNTEEVLAQLRSPGHQIPREALAEVIQRREEFVPLLIAAIEKATTLHHDIDLRDDLPFFALYLLAELRETRALEPILTWFTQDRLDDERPIFGDTITSDGAAILAAVAHDNPARLREYVRRPDLSPWVRAAVFDALVLQVLTGEQPRDIVVEFFADLFATNAFGNDRVTWTLLIGTSMDIHPAELLDGIRGIYERELVDLFVVGDFDEVEREAALDREDHLYLMAKDSRPITDTAAAVAGWACFEQRPRPRRHRLGHRSREPLPDAEFFDEEPGVTIRHEQPKIGRNDQCPCGSGKKYKKCCLPPGG